MFRAWTNGYVSLRRFKPSDGSCGFEIITVDVYINLRVIKNTDTHGQKTVSKSQYLL